MNETTEFLVNHVIPDVPIRHWDLTLPPPLRYLLSYDSELCTAVINIMVHTIFGWQRRVAKRELGLDNVGQAIPAAITAIHRVGSAINCNLHFHSVFLDGVFVQKTTDEPPIFRALPAPSKGDIDSLAWQICQKTTKMLQELGRYFDADAVEADKLAQDHPLLAACCTASLQGSVAIGDRAGQRVLRMGDYVERGEAANDDQAHGPAHGFNLHAGWRVSADDKKGRERLLHYILRPPIATTRLTRGKNGNVVYWLKTPWADGCKCFSFEPLDFIAKLLPLVPPPRANLTHYHGAWAPNAAIRAQIVPQPTDMLCQCGQLALSFGPKKSNTAGAANAAANGAATDNQCGQAHPRRDRPDKILWHDLASRTFGVDTLACENCGHTPMQVISVIHTPSAAQLAAISNPALHETASLWPRPSRAPPTGQMQFEFTRKAA